MESLPALPRCDLLDPADDQTLPRLMEVLERRHRVRQMMTEQFNKSGTGPFSKLQIIGLVFYRNNFISDFRHRVFVVIEWIFKDQFVT